ncbi:MAG: DUF460 domain-containing protein [Candidatus Odinarchaeota archaeon]
MKAVDVNISDVNRVVIGIDILPGSSVHSISRPKYAMAVLCNGDFKELKDKVTLTDIIYHAVKYNASILAVDNIFEVVASGKEVYRLLLKLPENVKLVQVTGAPGYLMKPVHIIASEQGLDVKGHLSPLENAKILAVLASRKIGFEIKAFENETVVTVSRSRNLGPGGSSQTRLRRRLHSFILNATRDIECKLKEAGVEYELITKESDFGLDSSKFIVNANKSDLKKIIRQVKGPDIKVSIKPVRSKSISYLPLSGEMRTFNAERRLIIGVDPGITTGLAIIDLDGNILDLKSSKMFSKGEVLNYIREYGLPLIYACDTMQVPELIVKLANATRSKIFSPRRIMSIAEKQELVYNFTRGCMVKITNSHKRDALAAAVKAYHYYKPIFDKIDLKLSKTPYFIPANKVKAEVIMCEKSISKAITDLSPKDKTVEQVSVDKTETKPILSEENIIVKELKKQVANLTAFNQQLKNENEMLRAKIKELEERSSALLNEEMLKQRRERAFQLKEQEIIKLREQLNELRNTIGYLQSEIHKLKSIKTLEAQGKIQPVKIARAFSKEALAELDEVYGILKNDIIFLEDAAGGGSGTAEMLIERGVKAIIARNDMSHLALEKLITAEIPVIPVEAVDMSKYSEFYAVDKDKFDKIYTRFLDDIRRRKTALTVEKLIEIINEYRQNRVTDTVNP